MNSDRTRRRSRHCRTRCSSWSVRTRRLVGVLNEFWATASTTYKTLVFSAMGLIAVGIILAIAGNAAHNQGLAVASLPVIGLGLVLHVAGLVVRGQQIRNNYKR